MSVHLKRTLFIGLGGTGIEALLHTKKLLMDTYGEVPPMIGFLAIDTDSGACNKSLKLKNGERVALANNEVILIQARDAIQVLTENPDDFAWVTPEFISVLRSRVCSPLRISGRFALTLNFETVKAKIKQMLLQINNFDIDDERYLLLGGYGVEINLVFSVSGATGSGTFINIASYINDAFPEIRLNGYAVLPGVFDAMTQSSAHIYPNAYAALKELDYTMHMGLTSEPITLNYLKGEYSKITRRLFSSMFFFDNKNEDHYVSHISELTENIGHILFSRLFGVFSTPNANDMYYFSISSGIYDVLDKRAWVEGCGCSEIVYNGANLSRIYQLKASKNIIERLLNSSEDADSIVKAWIDSLGMNIRDNGVAGFIMEPTPKYHLVISDEKNPEPDINRNITYNKPETADVDSLVVAFTDKVCTELTKLILEQINEEGGVSIVKSVILGIIAQLDIFKGIVEGELEMLRNNEGLCKAKLDIAVRELKEYAGRMWLIRRKSIVNAHCSAVVEATDRYNVNNLEIVRRQATLKVFNAINTMLLKENDKINDIYDTLKNVDAQLDVELANITDKIEKDIHAFQIDITTEVVEKVSFVPTAVQINAFAHSIGGDAIYSLYGQDTEFVKNRLMQYAQQRPCSQYWANTTIDDAINNMDAAKLDAIINNAIQKSSPLLEIDYRGHTPAMEPWKFYCIGVPNEAKKRLYENNEVRYATYFSTGANDRIIIYCQQAPVPVYALSCIEKCKESYFMRYYSDSNFIDAEWEARMIRENYAIDPHRPADEELLHFWVTGFILGLIKNENGEYKFKSVELGNQLFDNWISLGHYRDDAYKQFKQHRTTITREFTEHFENYIKNHDEDTVSELIADVKANYLDKYSQINMTISKIRARDNEGIRHLIERELRYVAVFKSMSDL